MENENHEYHEHHIAHKKESDYSIPLAIVVAAIIISSTWVYSSRRNVSKQSVIGKNGSQITQTQISALEETVLPSSGITLPVSWKDLGAQLVNNGTIDAEKLKAIYENRGQFTEEYRKLLLDQNDGKIKITKENAGYILNLFWAFGLANSNPILDSGEMTNKAYGGAGNFASTGGWTIAVGNPMDHYSRHALVTLTPEQQALVDRVSRGIFRPCCGNSTHFPDCNHGMAMLGLLELMASQGVSEADMYKTALAVNSYWFPDTYMTIATYMKGKGVEWKDVNPQEMLGANYSSGQGYAKIASQVTAPRSSQSGGGCGVDTGRVAPVALPAPKQQSGCGI